MARFPALHRARLPFRHLVLLLCALCVPTLGAEAQVVTFEPAFPNEAQPVTIYFHADQGTAGLKGYTGDVYAHTGVITSASTGPADWKYVKTNWGQNTASTKLERIGTDLYRFVIPDVRTYYGVPASEEILQLAFVFRSADASREGKDEGGKDIFVTLYEPGLNVRIAEPLSGPLNPIVTPVDSTIQVVAVASSVGSPLAGLRLEVDGAAVAQTTNDTLTYALLLDAPGRTDLLAIATAEDGSADTVSFYAVRNPDILEAPRPAGVEDGINYHADDQGRVTLSLFAPGKEFVYVIGDFTDWEVDPEYLMNRDYAREDSVHYWLTIDGLEPGREYAFQYFIDGELRLADLFSEKVLVPGADAFIGPETYPGLKAYPEGLTSGIVSVLQTDQEEFAFTPFERPPQKDLVIYELLLRDFLAAHDFDTLIDSLGYLDRLGVNAIELMPVSEFSGNLSWGYNPDFHLALDKYYGPAEDLKRLVDEAHKLGMAVILDVVYNHAHDNSPLVQLYGANASNPFINIPAKHPFNVFLDLNHENTYVQYWLDRANRYWIEEYNIDGYRFDLTKGFTQRYNTDVGAWGNYDASRVALLERMADEIWSVDSTAYVILEHLAVNDEERVLAHYGRDRGLPGMLLWANMNHPYGEAAMGYHGDGKSDFSGGYYRSRGWSAPNLVTYMESHDEERLTYKNYQYGNSSGAYTIQDLGTALERQKLAGAFFFTLPGPKMIWQFGELGYDVSIDFNGRTGDKPIRWEYLEDPLRLKLYKTWQALLRLRNEHEVFTSTDTQVSQSVAGAVKRIRLTHPTMNVTIVGNFDVVERPSTPLFHSTGTWYDFFSGEPLEVTDVNMQVNLLPGEFHIYTSQYVTPPESGLITVDAEEEAGRGLAAGVTLSKNAPNPFRGGTAIAFTLPGAGRARLAVYDLLGRQVAVLADGLLPAGRHEASFDGTGFPSGTYVYRLEAAGRVLTGKMVLVK